MSDIQIVAEIGCNHNGSVELAKKMMKKAKEAGADAVNSKVLCQKILFQDMPLKPNIRKKMMEMVRS